MNRNELYMLEYYKREELIKRLKPIVDWKELNEGCLIWHSDSNSIYGADVFNGIDIDNLVTYSNIGGSFRRSKTGWYYFDESIADEVNEYWTPKLWEVCDHREEYQCDRWFFIACNEKHLLCCWNEEQKDNLSYDEFIERYNLNYINKVDDFIIKVE